jgi:hypothetical protein
MHDCHGLPAFEWPSFISKPLPKVVCGNLHEHDGQQFVHDPVPEQPPEAPGVLAVRAELPGTVDERHHVRCRDTSGRLYETGKIGSRLRALRKRTGSDGTQQLAEHRENVVFITCLTSGSLRYRSSVRPSVASSSGNRPGFQKAILRVCM